MSINKDLTIPDKITPEKWKKLLFPFDKIQIAQKVFNYYKQILDLPQEVKLRFAKTTENGVYDDTTKTITINPYILKHQKEYSGLHLLNVIAHEAKHAQQYQLMHFMQKNGNNNVTPYQAAIIDNYSSQNNNPYIKYQNLQSYVQLQDICQNTNKPTDKIEALDILQPAEFDAYAFAMHETDHYMQQYNIEIADYQTKNRILGGAQVHPAIIAFLPQDKKIAEHLRQIYRDMCQQNLQDKDIPLFITLERAMILTHMADCNNKDQKTIDALLSDEFYTTETERLTELIHNMPERDDDEVVYEDEPDYAIEFQYGTREFQQAYHLNDDTQTQPSHKPSSHDDDEIDFP